MEKRDAAILFVLLGAGGYAVYEHWDVIAEKISLTDLSPGRLKAIELAKDSSDFERGFTNWQWMQTQQRRAAIELRGEPWSAEPIAGQEYTVYARWFDGGDPMVVSFRVDLGNRTVHYDGAALPATPR